MTIGVFELITVKQSIEKVQIRYPQFTRATLSGWRQRHNFPQAIISASPEKDAQVEGFYPKQIVDVISLILKFQEDGMPLKTAFEKLDLFFLQAQQDIWNKNIESDIFLHFASEDELFSDLYDEVRESLETFMKSIHTKESLAKMHISKKQIGAIKKCNEKIEEVLNNFVLRYTQIQHHKKNIKQGLWTSFSYREEFMYFSIEWNKARENRAYRPFMEF